MGRIPNFCVCLVLLAASTRPVEGRKMPGGPAWGFFNISGVGDPIKDLPLVTWSRRTGMHWSKLELPPGSGRYDWNYMDGLVREAQENNHNLVFVLKTGNHPEVSEAACYREARRGKGETALRSCPVKETYKAAWKRLVGAVIERYDGDGKGDMPGLADWFTLDVQIENEAGSRNYWYPSEHNGTRAAKSFLPLLQLAYEAKEAANPATRIIAPGIDQPHKLARCAKSSRGKECSDPYLTRNRDFAEEVLKHPQYFDVVDVHFFNYFRFDPLFIPDGMQWVRERMRRVGKEKPIHSLEWTGAMMMNVKHDGHGKAFLSHFPFRDAADTEAIQRIYTNLSDPRHEKYRRWFELEQSREFPKLFTTLLAQGVERLIHVRFFDYIGQGWNSVWWNWQGIVRYEGSRRKPVLIRKPVYYTYQALAPKLAGFQSVEVVAFGDYVAYKFLFPDRKPVAVAWTNRGERIVDFSRQAMANLVQVTPLVTELDARDRPIRQRTLAVKPAVVRLTETPVLIEAVESSN